MSEMPINLYTLAEDEQWNSADKMSRVQMENVAGRLDKLARILGFEGKMAVNSWGGSGIDGSWWGIDYLNNTKDAIFLSVFTMVHLAPAFYSDYISTKEACVLYALLTGEEL